MPAPASFDFAQDDKTRSLPRSFNPVFTGGDRGVFLKPDLNEVLALMNESAFKKKLHWPPEKIEEESKKFFLHYESNGLMIGSARMANTRAAVEKWLNNVEGFERKPIDKPKTAMDAARKF